MEGTHLLAEYAAGFDLAISPDQIDKFSRYGDLLLEWNRVMNLTAIVEPEEIVVKHFLDSILLLHALELPANSSILDVGTGAGFPAVPLSILRPDLRFTLLDSLNKRIQFLSEISGELGLVNCRIHGRAEDIAKQPAHREAYDCCVSRAVAALPVLLELSLPFVRVGGVFAAYKGPDAQAEVELSRLALERLGGVVDKTAFLELPGKLQRSFVIAKKISQTPPQYPRKPAQIAKSPLSL